MNFIPIPTWQTGMTAAVGTACIGEITTDKINNLLSLYQPLADATADMTASTDTDDPNTMTGNIYSDENILEKYYVQPMEYFYNYRTYASEVAKKAKENAAFYKEQGQTYDGIYQLLPIRKCITTI